MSEQLQITALGSQGEGKAVKEMLRELTDDA
jgi:hypothetical protein